MIDRSLIRAALDTPMDEDAIRRIWQRIEEKQQTALFQYWKPVISGLALASVCLCIVVVMWVRSDNRPLTLADRREIPVHIQGIPAAPVTLSDGSELTFLTLASLESLENSAARMELALRTGMVRFRITPGGSRRWVVSCGFVNIEVMGTEFTVLRSETTVRVKVHQGIVLVRGETVPDGVQQLLSGDFLRVQRRDLFEHTDIRPGAVVSHDAAEGCATPSAQQIETDKEESAIVHNTRAVSGKTRWKQAAETGNYREAFALLGEADFRSLSHQGDVRELFTLADVARLSGHPELAVLPLTAIVRRHARNPGAPAAAYTLGKIYLDNLNAPQDAAAAFRQSLRLGLRGTLRETAMARVVEAYATCGDKRRREVAESYLAEYPDGRYAREMMKHTAHAD